MKYAGNCLLHHHKAMIVVYQITYLYAKRDLWIAFKQFREQLMLAS
jgi:hypothetical protein